MKLTLKECEALARAATFVLRAGVGRADRIELASALRKLQTQIDAPWPEKELDHG
jgi:hypothetical protein